MHTCKLQFLNHFADDSINLENMDVLHTDLYESFHQLLKAMYRKTSKQAAFAIDETTELLNKAARYVIESSWSGTNHGAGAVQLHTAQIDGGLSVRKEVTGTSMEIQAARLAVYRKGRITMKCSVICKLLLESIGKDGKVAYS